MFHYGGYAGKVLEIDLTHETSSEYPWSAREQRQYLGGKAMAACILADRLTGREQAFSEGNPVVISTGPLTGTGVPGSARFDLTALSPKDNRPAFSNCGGSFGIWLKKAGYDGILLTGRCRDKRWLEIRDDRIVFHDAAALWGTGTEQCQKMLTARLGTDQFGRLCIGPAGENLVKFASVVANGHTAGRAGIGAVLGWKNLKAIAVLGSRTLAIHAAGAVEDWKKRWQTDLKRQSTGGQGPFCRGCPLHCPRHLPHPAETLLNDLGMDVIAAEDAAAFAAEQEIPAQDLYENIAFRRGMGDQLADGVPRGKGKGGKRRGSSHRALAEAFHLPADAPETEEFCRSMVEAISAAGQCMFTVNGLRADTSVLPMLNCVTGMDLEPDDLLRIGAAVRELEQDLKGRFRQEEVVW